MLIPPRRDTFCVHVNHFIPPPMKMTQMAHGLIVSDEGKLFSLTLHLALKHRHYKEGFLHVPHDFFPSCEAKYLKQTC